MRRMLYVLFFALIALGTACSDEDENNGGTNIFNPNTNTNNTSANNTSTSNNSTTGVNATTGSNASTPNNVTSPNNTTPTERCELNVANPGEMNGTWELVTLPSQTKWFEIRICHDLDDTNMDDSQIEAEFIETATGISGVTQTPVFQADPFGLSLNWFVNENGEEYQFALSQGSRVDENTISGRFLNGRLMETGDAQLRKVQ